MSRPSLILCVIAAAASCARPTRLVETTPADPAAGRAAFAFLHDPQATSIGLSADETLDPPRAREKLDPPSYPERALAARFGPATVAVRIVIDEAGQVSRVLDSPLMASSPGPFAEDFRQAVEDAVRTWRFYPGSAQRTHPGHDVDGDGRPDYRVLESSRVVAVYYDVRFDFEIIGGRGRAGVGRWGTVD